MARYIDADRLDTRTRGNNSQRTMWREIKRIVDEAPTADVAPKSEVEKYELIHKHIKNTILNGCDYSTVDAYNRAFSKELDKLTDIVAVKTEVAREIFEELEKALDDITIVYDPNSDFPAVVAKIFNKTINVIDELKKKYTEGEK